MQIRESVPAFARGEPAGLPIIAMTAYALDGDSQKALDSGMNDYISKPVDVTQLTNVLARRLRPKTVQPGAEINLREPVIPNQDELPERLDSIDMVSALARLDNRKVLYRKLLLMFHAEHEQDVPAIRAALVSNNLELARRLAHTLNGLAGTVGADELRAVAKDLEMAIAKGNTQLYEPDLAQVEQKLAVVMASIATLV